VPIVDKRAPTLLVIEDAQDQAILVGVAARRAHPGLEVHIAEDGQQGIDYLSGISPLQDPPANPTPDLVILDLEMPIVDGFGVLEWVRETLEAPQFPVVVLTASSNPDHEVRARELGATEIHKKPTDLAGLGETVKKIVTRWIDPGDIMAAHMRSAG
jgi:DNA-binding response OmpR family regulator